MKYRVKEVVKSEYSIFYPQVRICFIWTNIADRYCDTREFSFQKAYEHILQHKSCWEKTTTLIHRVDF